MFSTKVFLILSVLVAVSYGKAIKVKNSHSTALVVTVDAVDYTIVSRALLIIELADEWSGTISAVPVDAEIVDGPRTKVQLSLSAAGDSYSVSLVDGFNLPAKVVPNGATNCSASVCFANVLTVCPLADQVTNSNDTVVACQNSPLVMATVCPLAVVDAVTATNVQLCTTATSYLVAFL